MIKAIIVDDEKRSARVLKDLIYEVSSTIEVIKLAHTVEDGVRWINQLKPAIVFLDIKMPDGTGFDLLEQLHGVAFDIVFTTAFDDFAIKAIKFSAFDYLLKPIDAFELQETIEKLSGKTNHQSAKIQILLDGLNDYLHSNRSFEKIALPTFTGYTFVKVSNMIYCEADGMYCTIFLSNGTPILISKSLKALENLLNEHAFFRIHRSYLINMNHAIRFIKTDGGEVHMSNGDAIPVSQRRKDQFIKQLEHYRV